MKRELIDIPSTKTIIFPPWRDEREFWWPIDQVVGAFAMWAVRQSPYPVPDNLTDNCKSLTDLMKEAIEDREQMAPDSDEEWFKSNHEWIEKTMLRLFDQIPQIMEWNNRKNGNQASLGFSSRYDKPSPDNDFIDLHALARNIAHTLIREALIDES